jgi:hypothetical protein
VGHAVVDDRLYVLAHNGHLAVFEAPCAEPEFIDAPAAEPAYKALRAHAGRLLAEHEDGWVAIDPNDGARSPAEAPPPDDPVDPLSATHGVLRATFEARSGQLTVHGVDGAKQGFATQLRKVRHLLSTPDPDTWLALGDSTCHLLHVPTATVALRIPHCRGSLQWLEGSTLANISEKPSSVTWYRFAWQAG